MDKLLLANQFAQFVGWGEDITTDCRSMEIGIIGYGGGGLTFHTFHTDHTLWVKIG